MPLENQFYMGFYNKSLFAKAGVASVPTDWTQLYAACAKLKKIGVTPIVYGADPQAIGPSPYPFYDLSYIAAGVYSPSQLKGLYDGKIPWTSPALVSQVSNWASLPKHGCTNSDVLTKTNILGAFMKGQAAMIIDGNWDTATLYKALGSKVAPFLPPFTSKPQNGVVQYSGDGFSVSKQSKHQQGGRGVPQVPDDAAGREDHLGRRADPRRRRPEGDQPAREPDARLREAGQDGLPDDRQRDPG